MSDSRLLNVPFIDDAKLRDAMKAELKNYNCAWFDGGKYPQYRGWYYHPVTDNWEQADKTNFEKVQEIVEKYRNLNGEMMKKKPIVGENYIILRGELAEEIIENAEAEEKTAAEDVESYLYSLLGDD